MAQAACCLIQLTSDRGCELRKESIEFEDVAFEAFLQALNVVESGKDIGFDRQI